MKFLLDESAEFRIAAFLTNQGHDVKTIVREYTPGLPDSEVLAIARHEQRILITNDRDFGELIFRQILPHSGVIYFRLGLASTAGAGRGSHAGGPLAAARVAALGPGAARGYTLPCCAAPHPWTRRRGPGPDANVVGARVPSTSALTG